MMARMNHFFAFRRYGAAKWALVLASIGFSYALVTSAPSVSASAGAEVRALGTNCTRLPTEFVTLSDLGAVVVGSQFTRQILVRFGFKPHTFALGGVTNIPNTDINMSDAGKVKGALTNSGINFFEVFVHDSTVGVPLTPISQLFFLNAVDQQFGEAPLHYETGAAVAFGTTDQTIALPAGVAGEVYFFSLSANGGVPPYQFTLLEQAGGRFLPQGMAFDATNGLIYGKPASPTLAGQPANIDILLTDDGGEQVTGHFQLDILQGTITSQAVATAGSLNLRFGNENLPDSLSLTLLLDKSELGSLGIRTAADLNGLPIEMTFGGFKLPPDKQPKSTITIVNTFDAKGQISVPQKFALLGEVVGSGVKDVIYSIKLDPKSGILTAKFKNIDVKSAIGANFIGFEGQNDPVNRGPVIPINIRLGLTTTTMIDTDANGVLDKTDLIKFVYKRTGSVAHGTARLNDNLAPAGIFLFDKVLGTEQQVLIDAATNFKADRVFFQMKGLMRQPGAQPVIPKPGDSCSVFINRLCLGMFPTTSFSMMNNQLIFHNDDPSKGLKDLIIDNKKGTVLITTHGLDPNDELFGSDILIAGEPHTVPITLTIAGADPHNPTFDGQSTVTLFRTGSTI